MFYDMDTANGVSNTGEENVAKTAYIDGFSNANTTTGVNSLIIKQNDPNNGYDEYSSRLWDVLRDSRFKVPECIQEVIIMDYGIYGEPIVHY